MEDQQLQDIVHQYPERKQLTGVDPNPPPFRPTYLVLCTPTKHANPRWWTVTNNEIVYTLSSRLEWYIEPGERNHQNDLHAVIELLRDKRWSTSLARYLLPSGALQLHLSTEKDPVPSIKIDNKIIPDKITDLSLILNRYWNGKTQNGKIVRLGNLPLLIPVEFQETRQISNQPDDRFKLGPNMFNQYATYRVTGVCNDNDAQVRMGDGKWHRFGNDKTLNSKRDDQMQVKYILLQKIDDVQK